MKKERGSIEAIKEIVSIGKTISIEEMADIRDAAVAAGGELIAIEPDGDGCGAGTIRFPWPPKPEEFMKVLNVLVEKRMPPRILINGIPWPDYITLNVSRLNVDELAVNRSVVR